MRKTIIETIKIITHPAGPEAAAAPAAVSAPAAAAPPAAVEAPPPPNPKNPLARRPNFKALFPDL
ncbi:MAG: hypothetical protein COU27_01630 [Candidatus Levybacteria bacterium CG10_big_fil_rev_8_21_14_0_10_36_7]|nr:MAG: hypothetical protein COU27_01630 [Candidatus Levybacteria bacterium CG10_big_fil_rev_8_21_14_0_10_36_7]